jgi:hypothetical protein
MSKVELMLDDPAPFDPESLRLAREVLRLAIANSRPLSEAMAEARGILFGREAHRGLQEADAAIESMLRGMDVVTPAMLEIEYEAEDGRPYREASAPEVSASIFYSLRFDERGRSRKTGIEFGAKIAADMVVRHLRMSGYLILKPRKGTNAHTAG